MNESLSVLVVDDDISIQSVVEEILSDGGFEPKAASSGEEAIALLNAHRFRVIIDIAFGKPFPPAQLLTAVSQLLTTGTPQVTGL